MIVIAPLLLPVCYPSLVLQPAKDYVSIELSLYEVLNIGTTLQFEQPVTMCVVHSLVGRNSVNEVLQNGSRACVNTRFHLSGRSFPCQRCVPSISLRAPFSCSKIGAGIAEAVRRSTSDQPYIWDRVRSCTKGHEAANLAGRQPRPGVNPDIVAYVEGCPITESSNSSHQLAGERFSALSQVHAVSSYSWTSILRC